MADDMLITIKQINEKRDNSIYVLYADNMVVATSYKTDMDKFLSGEDSLVTVHDESLDEVVLVHGVVLDPTVLPFEIPKDIMKDRNLWLIKDEKESMTLMEPYADLVELTEAIETYLEEEEVDIDDFAVILAKDIELSLSVGETGISLQVVKVYG